MSLQSIIKKRIVKAIEAAAYRGCMKQLDTMTLEQISVEAIMSDFKSSYNDPESQQKLAQVGFGEDDIRQIAEHIVPKLRAEKEKRLSK